MDILKKSHQDPAMPKSTFLHIGQDRRKTNSACKDMYKSTIKDDYPAIRLVGKRSRVPSPEQAKILSVERRINEQKSVTATHFAPQTQGERTVLSDVAKLGLGTKNLTKMDVDNRILYFDTTHKEYFPVRALEKVESFKEKMCNARHIPEGDKEKVRLPFSTYKQSFPEDQLSKLDVAKLAQFHTPPILRGDTRSYGDQFETTNSKTFREHIKPVKRQAIKNTACNVRLGGPDLYAVTTNQKFFKEKPLQRVQPCGPSYVSSVVIGDDSEEWSSSTYRQKSGPLPRIETQHLQSRLAKLNMGKSSLPSGDMEPDRALQRVTQTTSKSFFKKPVVVHPYSKVNGAYLMTNSKIRLGTENAVAAQHYSTTTRSNFPAKCEPVERRHCQTTHSNVCLDYYGNQDHQSTTVSDFCSHNTAKRLLPNPESITKLTASHIQLPRTSTKEFGTTHSISYPPKETRRYRKTYDAGKLHKSSIKLGNTSVH